MVAAREEELVANGLRHHVLRWGTNPVDVVLCHGFLDIAWSFDRLARLLVEAGHSVASFDWRGHGQSEWVGSGGYYHFTNYVLDLDAILPEISEAPVHLLGHSMGGTACAMYAAARPERLRSVALIEGLGPPEFEPRDPTRRLRSWLDGVARVRSKSRTAMPNLEEALRRMRMQNPKLGEELGMFLAEKSTRATDDGLDWTFDPLHKTFAPRSFEAAPFVALLSKIEVPTLLVAGENGLRLDDEAERVAAIPKHRFVEIPEVGHMIHWFEPERLAEILVEFFNACGLDPFEAS